jgi:Fic family protein
MVRFSLEEQREVFFSSTATSRAVRTALRAGRVRHVAGRLYTKNLDEPLERVVRCRWSEVAAGMFPGAVIVDRTAFEARPVGPEGSVFLCSNTARVVRLPGLVLNCRRGVGPARDEAPFPGVALYLSSRARRFLDNMRPSRARSGTRRTLSRSELEAQLEMLLANQGEEELNKLRDAARDVAKEVDREPEFEELTALIGALIGTHDSPLVCPLAKATRASQGWDDARLELFDALFAVLHAEVPLNIPAHREGPTFSFYEAYFSNFIEGTEFTVQEATAIVFEGAMPADRPKDAHDVLGTFDLVSDSTLNSRTPSSADDLLALLKLFHARIMAMRPEERPGEFKTTANRAGGTEFVSPRRVRGTLERGYEYYASLAPGFQRAAFLMFLISEVHPFGDGNGRVARALANAELSAAGQQRLMIPIVYRDDYLGALRVLSRLGAPAPLIRALARAQAWSSEVDWSSMASALADLQRTNALLRRVEAEEQGVILRRPSELLD